MTDRLSQLIYEAEHAETGSDFSRMMMVRHPDNPRHRERAERLAARATRLRAEIERLQNGG